MWEEADLEEAKLRSKGANVGTCTASVNRHVHLMSPGT